MNESRRTSAEVARRIVLGLTLTLLLGFLYGTGRCSSLGVLEVAARAVVGPQEPSSSVLMESAHSGLVLVPHLVIVNNANNQIEIQSPLVEQTLLVRTHGTRSHYALSEIVSRNLRARKIFSIERWFRQSLVRYVDHFVINFHEGWRRSGIFSLERDIQMHIWVSQPPRLIREDYDTYARSNVRDERSFSLGGLLSQRAPLEKCRADIQEANNGQEDLDPHRRGGIGILVGFVLSICGYGISVYGLSGLCKRGKVFRHGIFGFGQLLLGAGLILILLNPEVFWLRVFGACGA